MYMYVYRDTYGTFPLVLPKPILFFQISSARRVREAEAEVVWRAADVPAVSGEPASRRTAPRPTHVPALRSVRPEQRRHPQFQGLFRVDDLDAAHQPTHAAHQSEYANIGLCETVNAVLSTETEKK